MQTVLFIGLVWPEPKSSAAGTRIIQLIQVLLGAGCRVVFASAAAKSPYSYPLLEEGVEEVAIKLNDASFDIVIQELKPDTVVFDRFMIEEQYGWRVRQFAPAALTILDTEDLHFLRAARQEAVRKNSTINLYNMTAKREIASILRCDLSLIISQDELSLLQDGFNMPHSLLYYLPFLEKRPGEAERASWPTFEQRKNFMFIGNFLHEPNWYTVQVIKKEVWPVLKKLLPEAEMHIYGAYATEKVFQLHQPRDRFFIKDRAEDARLTMQRYRVLLAPIAFGAGAKGKFVDAMQTGTPSVSTRIGAESMTRDGRWNGFIEDDPKAFAEQAALLYTDEKIWQHAQAEGIMLLGENYDRSLRVAPFLARVAQLQDNLLEHRQAHFIGEILHSQQLSSTKYMALWIEEKNKGKGD